MLCIPHNTHPASSKQSCVVCRVCRLGGPISLQAALVFISSLVSLAFAGHLGKLSLSQAVLATSAYNITGVSMLLGLASGMETLCSQVPRACFPQNPLCRRPSCMSIRENASMDANVGFNN